MTFYGQRDQRNRFKVSLPPSDPCPACGSQLIPGEPPMRRDWLERDYYCTDRSSCRMGFRMTVSGGRMAWSSDIGKIDDALYAAYAKARAWS